MIPEHIKALQQQLFSPEVHPDDNDILFDKLFQAIRENGTHHEVKSDDGTIILIDKSMDAFFNDSELPGQSLISAKQIFIDPKN